MKAVADASVDLRLVRRLRATGVDVIAVIETEATLPDPDILARSVAAQCVLLTEDKGFGDLAFGKRAAAFGVILIRARVAFDEDISVIAARIVEALPLAQGAFITLTEKQTRRRPLPQG